MTPIYFYNGVVRHRRLSDPPHVLQHKVTYALIDLDRLDEANSASLFFGAGKRGFISINPKDHGDGKSPDLAQWARATLIRHGVEQEAARIELLTLPRLFGYVFNPISIYFFYDRRGVLHHILYEVNNTFGGRHFYLVEAEQDQRTHKHRCDKAFHVSPFLEVKGHYDFNTTAPGRKFSLRIAYHEDESKPALHATFSGWRAAVSNAFCLKVLLRFPFMTLGVIAAIHWHALRLFLKGARLRNAHGRERQFGGLSKGTRQENGESANVAEAA